MSETSVVSVKVRSETGSRAAKRLRANGQIPAVLYGHKEQVVHLMVSADQVESLLRHGAHSLLDLDLDGKHESAVIKDLQWDVFGREVLHVDFARVSKGERITLEVPIQLKGTAPGVAEGGIIDHQLHSVEIECSADNIQENIVVNINQLHVGQAIFVKDLKVHEGTKVLADADQIVVQVMTPKTVEEPEIAEPTSAEPELIRREAKAEEGEE